uniref:Uncharacterized protein n=1 Tax=viral metagenome TaxID=1070528 RepID=A0A6C0K761_9ZZZZ
MIRYTAKNKLIKTSGTTVDIPRVNGLEKRK